MFLESKLSTLKVVQKGIPNFEKEIENVTRVMELARQTLGPLLLKKSFCLGGGGRGEGAFSGLPDDDIKEGNAKLNYNPLVPQVDSSHCNSPSSTPATPNSQASSSPSKGQ